MGSPQGASGRWRLWGHLQRERDAARQTGSPQQLPCREPGAATRPCLYTRVRFFLGAVEEPWEISGPRNVSKLPIYLLKILTQCSLALCHQPSTCKRSSCVTSLWSVWTPPVTLWESPVTLWDTSCHPLGIPTASGTHRRLAHGSQEASRPSWLPLYSAQARLLQRKALARGTEQLGGFLWLLVRPRCHKPPSVPRLGFL